MPFSPSTPQHRKRRQRFATRLAMLPLCLCLLTALALPAGATGAEPPPADTQIKAGVSITLPGGQGTVNLTDANYNTWVDLAGGEINLESESPFAYVYLVWDTPPGPWQLAAGAETLPMGQNDYLHELVTLAGPVTTAAIQLPEGASRLCDVYLFGEGPLPGWVQQWQPILEAADLLALPTHADDEHLFFGGILPTYAGQRQLAVQVVYMTNHWGERYRPHELLNGLWTVGVTAYPLIGPFPDLYASKESLAAAEQTFGRDAVLEFQVEILRRFKPKVVVGHDLQGEYGHGAHMLNAETLLQALPLCGDEAAYPASAEKWGTWQVPKLYLHLYAENEIVMDWDTPLDRFEGKTGFEMAQAGFACHKSQTEYFSVQQSGTWQDCRKFGLAHTLVGPDVQRDDLFENIDLTPEPEPEPEPALSSSAPSLSIPSGLPASLPAPGSGEDGPAWLPIALVALAGLLVLLMVLVLALRPKRKKQKQHHRRM